MASRQSSSTRKKGLMDLRQGGAVSGGTPGRDTVPAVHKPGGKAVARFDNGEYVLPRKTVKAVGKPGLDALVVKTNGKPPVGYAQGGQVSGWTAGQKRAQQIEDAVAAAVQPGQVPALPQAPVMPAAPAAEPVAQSQETGMQRWVRRLTGQPQPYAAGGLLGGGYSDPDSLAAEYERQMGFAPSSRPASPEEGRRRVEAIQARDERLAAGPASATPAKNLFPDQAQRIRTGIAGVGDTTGSSTAGGLGEGQAVGAVKGPRLAGTPMMGSGYGSAPALAGAAAPSGYAPAVVVPKTMPAPQPSAQTSPGFFQAVGQLAGEGTNAVETAGRGLEGARQAAASSVADAALDLRSGYQQARTPAPGIAEAPNPGPVAQPVAAPVAGSVDIPVSRPVAAPGTNRPVRGASPVGLDATTMRQVGQGIAERAASPAVAGPNDYITPMEGANGRPIYRNLVAPDGQAEYGKAIYSDSVPGATRAGLDQAIKTRGTATPAPDAAAMRQAQKAQNGLDLAKQYYATPDRPAALGQDTRGPMPDAVADFMGKPRVGAQPPTLAERKQRLDEAQYVSGRQDREQEQGMKQLEVQLGMSKDQRAAAREWDQDLAKVVDSFASKAGDSNTCVI